MTKLEQLIAELCPNGVEFKKVKDVFKRLKGTPITAGKMKEIENPNGEIRIFAGGKTVINANEADIPNANITRVPAVLVQSRGVIDVVYYEKPFTFKNEMWAYTTDNKTTVKYLYYVLKNSIQHFRDAASGMGSLPQISLPVTEEFYIPVPPLQVQSEIVRILDNFTEFTSKLTSDLTLELIERKQQYECYKQRLFSSVKEEAVELGSIADFSQGLQVDVNKQYQEIKSNCIRFLRIVDFVSDNEPPRYIEKPDDRYIKNDGELIMIRYGASAAGKVFIKHSGAIANNMFKINVITKNVNTKYLMYYLSQKRIYELLNKTGGKSTMPAVNFGMVSKIKIPIPSIEEQERIVAILERFDSLYNDISEGLTAEIEGRRKQYEYYRDKLLTFKEKAN